MKTKELLLAQAHACLASKEALSLTEMITCLEVSRATAIKFLKNAEANQLIRRENVIYGPGRPKAIYYSTPNLDRIMKMMKTHQFSDDLIISLPFRAIMSLCKYNDYDLCNARSELRLCEASRCAIINDDAAENRE